MTIRRPFGLFVLWVFIILFSTGDGIAQGAIKHKEGEFYKGFTSKGLQKTGESREIIYINPNESSIHIDLPSLSNSSPHAYFRWFRYNTDGHSPNIDQSSGIGTEYPNGYVLADGTSDLNNIDYNVNNLPDTIACEVSAYTDYIKTSGYVDTEPTLSYRNVFEIRDANEIATQLKSLTDQGKYFQETYTYMPSVPATSFQLPRVTLTYKQSNYFGYDGAGNLSSGTLSFTGATYDSNNDRFIFVNPGAVNDISEIIVTLTVGSGSNAREYKVARFKVKFIAETPAEFTSSGYRSTQYMDKNYYMLSHLNMDYDTKPATADNNMWDIPLEAGICEYGFTSEKLFNESHRGTFRKVAQWNEYGFYKTANVALPDLTGYIWYNGGKKVYDRRYFETNGRESGYFMYIDASASPGIIAQVPIEKLCAGTKIFVSGAIASLTVDEYYIESYPDLNAVFYGIESDGRKVELSRYTTGDIPSYNGDGITPWYQAYYSFTFEEEHEYVSYLLQLENNCTSSGGGDYALDDLRIYRSKPAVQAFQPQVGCEDEDAKVKVMIEYNKLLSTMGKSEVTSGNGEKVGVKFKIVDKDSNPLTHNYGTVENPNMEYGQISISTNFNEMTALLPNQDPPIATGNLDKYTYTEIDTIDNIIYRYVTFLVPNVSDLNTNTQYRAVVADANDYFGTGTCSLISDPFTITPPNSISVDGSPWLDGSKLCYGNTATIGVTLTDRSGSYKDIESLFDWYFGTKAQFETKITGTSYSLHEALDIYRQAYPKPDESDELSNTFTTNYTQEIYNILKSQIDNEKLTINKKTIVKVIRQADVFLAIPLLQTAQLPSGLNDLELCGGIIEIDLDGPPNNPTMKLGNASFKSLRLGLVQYSDLKQNSTKTLTIPVFDFANADGTKAKALTTADDVYVYLIETDDSSVSVDPNNKNTFIKVARIQSINVSNALSNNIVLNIPSDVTFEVREGYTYRFEFHFNQITTGSDAEACDGTSDFLIKVVPEYQVWTGAKGDNWNNDDNWRRSTKNELYKDSYIDDTESKGFVPLNFTKVIIPTNASTYPWLYKLSGTPFLDMENTNYTDVDDKTNNAATDSISYDLVLRTNASNYDCINFYGNTTDQIYFKPRAEMRNTNYLTYTKAHVDFELATNRWYMLSSPLKNVVAGDMYLPLSTGRQTTEAFAPITYSSTTNNRFGLPVYQRSWDKANSIVLQIDGNTEDTYTAATWSKVYNKVEEMYKGGEGFSIRVMPSAEHLQDSVMFRLPKDDNAYSYYSYDGQTSGDLTAISRTNNGRLVFENNATSVDVSLSNQANNNNIFLTGNPFIATMNMATFFDRNTGFERKYWILSAGQLIAVQIADDGTITSTDDDSDGTISAMQSFFVERKDGSNTTNVTYTPDMTQSPSAIRLRASQNTDKSLLQKMGNELRLKVQAVADGMQSTILIQKQADANNSYRVDEDVQALLSSNLDSKLLLYSMAGSKALTINNFNNLDSIPLGVFVKDSNAATLSFSGIENFSNGVFLVDRVRNSSVALRPVDNIVVAANEHKRYYLKFSNTLIDLPKEENQFIKVYSPEKGRLIVQTTNSSELKSIWVYNLNGSLAKKLTSLNGSQAAIDLVSGQVYILKISYTEGEESIKVYCR